MAHFAKVENGIVVEVVVVDNEHEADGEAYLNSLGLEGTWVQTSYSASFGGKFAGRGYTYDEASAEFIEPPVPEEIIIEISQNPLLGLLPAEPAE